MLKELKVIEFEGLAPSVFCGMYFADQGAEVIIISRPEPPAFSMPIHKNIMNRNKKCVTLSLKEKEDR
jgi:alpha-methylacyl-CoA racemase